MFDTFIVQPIFNLLVAIYAILPGHNFGLAIILFTIIIRLVMWPLVKKQLHHAKAMRELQPEIKRIKQKAAGDKQKESMLIMELYKEREINPFASIGLLLVQLPILIALYVGINKIIHDPNILLTFTYSFMHQLGSIKDLVVDINRFDSTLFGVVDLTRSAVEKNGGIYWPAFLIVLASAVTQFFQGKQLMPNDKDAKSLKQILKEASDGKQADQADVNAAVGRSTKFLMPAMIFIFTINLPSALPLYWLTSGLVALAQQHKILAQDEQELAGKEPKVTEKTPETKAKPRLNKKAKKTRRKK